MQESSLEDYIQLSIMLQYNYPSWFSLNILGTIIVLFVDVHDIFFNKDNIN